MVNLGFTEQERAILDKPFASGHPHVFLNKEDGICLEVEAWIKAGRPHVLVVVARSANYTGVMDTGYGKMFLLDTETGEVAQALNHIALLNDAMFLDKKYYGISHWIFIAENEKKTKMVGDILDFIQDRKFLDAENIEKQKLRLLLRKERLRAKLHAANDEDYIRLETD